MARIGIPYLDFDALITAIQALSAPSATDVAVSTANMHYITEDDAQGALAELDAEAYATNSSLTQLKDYSTTETVIGKWYNYDLPIYRRVYSNLSLTTTANTWIDTGILKGDINRVLSASIGDGSGQYFPCAIGWTNGGNYIAVNVPLARTDITTLVIEYYKNI